MTYPIIQFIDSQGELLSTDDDGTPYVKQFGDLWSVQLDRNWEGGVAVAGTSVTALIRVATTNQWELPKALVGEIVRRSGEVSVVLTDTSGTVIDDCPRIALRIQPANLTNWQIDRMISDIGILALSTACCVRSHIPVPMGEGFGIEGLGQQWVAGKGLLASATALLELAEVVQDNWEQIEKRPLRSFVNQIGVVEVGRSSFSPQMLIKAKVEPTKRRMLGITRAESTNCSENEFLCYILDVYLRDLASGLIASLQSLSLSDVENSLIPSRSRRKDSDFQEFLETAKRRVKVFKLQREELMKQISVTVEHLQACAIWANQARKAKFLEDIVTPREIHSSSLRLVESPSYGPIFDKYSNARGGVFEAIQKVLHLFERIYRGEVRPTWEIYEIWCFIKLYSAFILYSNMEPVENQPTIFESIQIEDNGFIKIPKNKNFSLRGWLDDSTSVSVSLSYEPELRNQDSQLRKPDIVVCLSVGGITKKYCFDAKYRDYFAQGHNRFIEDVSVVAKKKYLEGLCLSSSFILHTDERIDYWGEVPLDRFILEEFEEEIDAIEYVGHQYGAIAFVPKQDEDRQIKRILRLLLQYHSSALSTTCLPCGTQLGWGTEVRSSWMPDLISETELIRRVVNSSGRAGRGTGLYCSCPECGDFWVIQSCYGPHHHLIKFKDCFHRNSDHPEFKGKWMYICPVCGSDPSLAELNGASPLGEIDTDF